MPRRIWLILFLLLTVPFVAAAPVAPNARPAATLTVKEAFPGAKSVSGAVYWDENGNGRRDPGERGVAGVRLTTLHKVATTDEKGEYTFTSDEPFFTIALSFPSGTWPTAGWFRHMSKEHETGADFGLRREEQGLPFVFVQVTDPHTNLRLAAKTMAEECAALPLKPKFYFVTGDLCNTPPKVGERPGFDFEIMHRVLTEFPAPIFMLPGNHDMVDCRSGEIPPEESGDPLFGSRCWEKCVCPSEWSFSYGGVHFMGLGWADCINGKWDALPVAAKAWMKDELKAFAADGRTVLLAHNPDWHAAAVELGVTLGLFGHWHTEGGAGLNEGSAAHPKPALLASKQTDALWDLNTMLVSGAAGWDPRTMHNNSNDGRPAGYRIVVVEADRMETFFKAFTEPHTIMIHFPRRDMELKGVESFVLRGQVFDPDNGMKSLKVSLAGRALEVRQSRRRLWWDFDAVVRMADVADGFQNLTVEAAWADGAYVLTEPYFFHSGKPADFAASGPAQIKGDIVALPKPCRLMVNGVAVGEIQPGAKTFSLDVPAAGLKRLNRLSLDGADNKTLLENVSCAYAGKSFVDQRPGFRRTGRLESRRDVFVDLESPGPLVEWRVRKIQSANEEKP